MIRRTKKEGCCLKGCLTMVAIAVLMPFLLISCLSWMLSYPGYRGEYPELYTVAVHNMFGISGFKSNGEICYDPRIYVMEEDDYGRVLFFYDEYYCGAEEDYGMAFGIMQQKKNGKVYYYPEVCCLPYFGLSSDVNDVLQNMDRDALEILKQCNDWGKPVDLSKCAQKKPVKKKPDGKLARETRLDGWMHDEEILLYAQKNGYTGNEDSPTCRAEFCYADQFGRELYYVSAFFRYDGPDGEYRDECYEYAMIFKSAGKIAKEGIIEIPSPQDSVEQIKALKQRCQWNAPLT